AADWFRKEIELAENALELWQSRPRSDWMKLREPAAHARDWCDAAASALQGLQGEFAVVSSRLSAARRGSEALASWRGEFTLRIAVVPFGQVKSLKRRGQEVELKERDTPLVLPDLDIDDY